MEYRGVKITVSIEGERGIEGWLYGKHRLVYTLPSTNTEKQCDSFLGKEMGISYDHDAPKAEFGDDLKTDAVEAMTRFEQTFADRFFGPNASRGLTTTVSNALGCAFKTIGEHYSLLSCQLPQHWTPLQHRVSCLMKFRLWAWLDPNRAKQSDPFIR